MLAPFTHEPRPICATCRRPEVVCYCRFVTKIEARTRVVILQHPRERDVPINTARIASLCLPSSELHVGTTFADESLFRRGDRPVGLLYPSDHDSDAIDIEKFPPKEPITLVVVDGTWSQARKLVRTNPVLSALPRYAFRPDAPSNYRIRKEPQEDYVSTIEALVHVLGVLEGDRARFLPMLEPFRAMVDSQLAYAKRRVGPPRKMIHRRVRKSSHPDLVPSLLVARPDDVLCVFGEASAWPYDAGERAVFADELVQWVALRPATGETFDAIVAPSQPMAPNTLMHTELSAADVQDGMSPAELARRFADFVRPEDIVCSWGHYGLALFRAAGGTLPEIQVDLRLTARKYEKKKVGPLETYRETLGLEQLPVIARGRAGRRLADVGAIARMLSAGRANSAK
ncbi:tRNA-uridine aminocarboxypropyltransferase [soil metagenome]